MRPIATAEPAAYLAERIRGWLLADPRVRELDVHVAIEGNRVYLTGNVATPERRDAVSSVLADRLPEHVVVNELIVPSEAPSGGEEVVG